MFLFTAVNFEVLDCLATHRVQATDILVLIKLAHPKDTTPSLVVAQRQLLKDTVHCMNRFRNTKSIRIALETKVINLDTDAAWVQFSDAVNFYKLNFVDWELFVGFAGKQITKIEIGSRVERRLEGL